jgi:hypothetical protein
MTDDIDPQAGTVQMHTGCHLFWEQNAAGGRTYTSDEIAGGVLVWDTCLVEFATLCEAFSMEIALQGIERRATERRERARQARMPDGSLPSDSSAPPPHAGFALLTGAHGPAGSTSQAPSVRPADEGPCPNCGALGCWTPCPYEPPAPSLGRFRTPEAAAKRRELLERVSRSDMGPNIDDESIPEGVAVFEGDTLPDVLRPLTHRDVTVRVHLIRARDQLLRYSSEDPLAAEITKLLAAGSI